MGMYQIEVSWMAEQDRQTIIDLLTPHADDGRVYQGIVSGIGTFSAFYEDGDTAYALALQCEMTMNCKVKVAYHATDCPLREKRKQAATPFTSEERRYCAPLNGNRDFRLLR